MEKQTVATSTGYKRVPSNNEITLKAVVAQQLISVEVDASKDFQLYKGGMFRRSCSTIRNHAVALIGYGVDGGTNYWLVKNTWGTKWGE